MGTEDGGDWEDSETRAGEGGPGIDDAKVDDAGMGSPRPFPALGSGTEWDDRALLEQARPPLTFGSDDAVELLDDQGDGRANPATRGGVLLRYFSPVVLFFAVVAISSAASVFRYLDDVAPLTRAGWRLQVTAVLLAPGFVYQWRQATAWVRERFIESVGLLVVSGALLAVHFGAWVWSIDNTSISHSLLFVCTTPLIILLYRVVLRLGISVHEVAGACVAATGALLLSLDSSVWEGGAPDASDHPGPPRPPHWTGDLAALLAAACMACHMSVGGRLRTFMPLYLYATTVTLIGSLLLTVVAAIAEPNRVGVFFGFFFGPHAASYWWPVLYLGVGPGLVGHTGLNAVLRYHSALVVSMSLLAEPLVGSLLAYWLGLGGAPTAWTWIGGLLMLLGMSVVTYYAYLHDQKVREERDVAARMARMQEERDLQGLERTLADMEAATAGDVEMQQHADKSPG